MRGIGDGALVTDKVWGGSIGEMSVQYGVKTADYGFLARGGVRIGGLEV